jgi:flagellar hook-associated protein 3 FlgL
MRVSTSLIFTSGKQGIQERQFDMYKAQNQMSTGRRVLTPADDPIAASEALKVDQSKGVTTQMLENQNNALSSLTFLEGTLGSVNNELDAIFARASDAGNTNYSASDRGMLAAELKKRMQNLIGLANTQDGTGLYVFAGFKSTTQPFQNNPGATQPYALGGGTLVSYNGDAGQQSLLVSQSAEMAISENGLDVFMRIKDASGNVVGRSMFDSLQNMIDILDPTSGVPYTAGAYNQAIGDLRSAISHVANVRATVGARQNSLETLIEGSKDRNLQYTQRLSDLQDLDYTEAISRFANYKVQLEAAQTTFKEISQLSLFNIL